MKRALEILVLFFLSVSLCSCPYSSPYNLDQEPGIYVDDALLGSWSTLVKRPNGLMPEPVTVTFSRRNDMEYDIAFSGNLNDLKPYMRIINGTIAGTAFMSAVGSKQFFNIKLNSRVYIAEVILKDGHLSLLPLAEHFTAKLIFSSEALRNSVDFHYKTRVHPTLDEDFCLRDMVKSN